MSIKKIIKTTLSKMNIGLINLRTNRSTMDCAFQGIVKRQHNVQTVIDVGASDGRWSADLLKYLPDARYLLIEAQPRHEAGLQVFCGKHPNCSYALAAAGNKPGQVYFNAGSAFGGQASFTKTGSQVAIPMLTLDDEVKKRHLPAPYLIKLDTHGFEVPILEGSLNTLKLAEVVIMECYNFRISPQVLLFDEMCAYMRKFGFSVIDLVDPLHRPHDRSFWQMDLVFIRSDRPEFSYTRFR